MQADYFTKKKRNTLSILLIIAAATFLSIFITEYDVVKGVTSVPSAVQWALSNFYPTKESLSKLPDILEKLKETLLVSIAASTLGALFALIFSILGSNTTGVNPLIKSVCRGIATFFRNIDVAAWAMILLFSFGQSSLTGYFALFFGSFGFLTRAFTETIDEASGSSVEALKATGAGYLSIIFQSVIPASLPQMISWILFMIETNIRSATLIGLLTGSGIGFTFNLYYKNLSYDIASLVVIVIALTILLIEYVSNYVRRAIL
ncbi:phosphate/phosphonate ABC transporter permease [Mesobacillus foraminis]|uniref:PhnE/PtxC family ABC transporter permease n=1 Tax=Mesobacillus foraminis TaxID=279826 RepID=UPI001BECC91F|nr:phosphate/phosphonate ABC transporter permease [Mesobacillus foraminis]MBT2758023.1 phosphate/phosphonate ABC transporter permease [Mesobacillus foraminis]